MPTHDFVEGTPLVLNEDVPGWIRDILQLETGHVYRPEGVRIFPKRTLLPSYYIEQGYVPDCYKPHLIKGSGTTNHDSIGSDRWVRINGQDFLAAYFRKATANEVNRQAKSAL